MAFGILAKNDFGNVQIDENYKNLFLAQKGTVSTSSGSATVTITGARLPIIAIRSTAGQIGWAGMSNPSSGTFNFFIKSQNATQSFDYWIFDSATNLALPNFGLLVKNASGEVVFRSDKLPLRVDSAVTLTAGSSATITTTAGRKSAIIFGTPFVYASDPLNPVYYTQSARATSDNTMTVGLIFVNDINGLALSIDTFQNRCIMVDVTNY